MTASGLLPEFKQLLRKAEKFPKESLVKINFAIKIFHDCFPNISADLFLRQSI